MTYTRFLLGIIVLALVLSNTELDKIDVLGNSSKKSPHMNHPSLDSDGDGIRERDGEPLAIQHWYRADSPLNNSLATIQRTSGSSPGGHPYSKSTNQTSS